MNVDSIKKWVKSKLPWTDGITRKLTAKTWPRKSIAYYRGNYAMVTEQDLRDKGVSGSEAATIFLTQEWVKQGYQVTVFANCGEREGVVDGVKHLNFRRINWYDRFDIVVAWKHPFHLDDRAKARKKYLEWQDITHPPKWYVPEVLNRFDKIFSKSQYQRKLLPEIADDKFKFVSNGYDSSILQYANTPKKPYKLVYASRYYRGLEDMLEHGWSRIKEAIPEAELHLFYGFTRVESGPSRAEWRAKMEKLMEQPGVINHGLVGYQELIQEKASAAIHYYACTYGEVDCISVRESSIVGCVPVTTDAYVFAEKEYCLRIPGEPAAPETQAAIADKIIELLQNPDRLEEIRQKFQAIAQQETWENIAKVWMDEFERDLPDKPR